ncbi:MAG: PrsW family intramembrane metalloprotease [Candidatus Paceibacteria bacterium]
MDVLFFAILGGGIPSILWWGILLTQDRHPEKKHNLITTFFLGVLTAIPVIGSFILIEWVITETRIEIPLLIYNFITGALIEEIFKALILYLFIFHRSFFSEPIDAFIYGITIALGFAAIENILLVFNFLSQVDNIAQLTFVVGIRSITAVVVHIVSSGIIAYGLYLAVYAKQIFRLCLSFILGVGIHGAYNILVEETETISQFVNVYSGIVLLGGIILYRRVKYMQKKSVSNTHLDEDI